MKVLFVFQYVPFAGSANSFRNMLLGLQEKGVEPYVVFQQKGDMYDDFKKRGIHVYCLPYRTCIYPPSTTLKDIVLFIPRLFYWTLKNEIVAGQISKIARCSNVDIIHTNASINNVGYKAAVKLNIPHVWHIREYADLDFGYHYVFTKRSFLRKLNKSRSYSISITKDIALYNGLEGNKNSRVIYNGVMSENDAVAPKKEKEYFLYAGRLEKNKGIEDLLDAYVSFVKFVGVVKAPNLYIAGDTGHNEYKNILNEKISQSQANNKVFFLGMRKDLFELMKNAIAVIVPSVSEGFGRVMPEAMFAAALVIGRNTGGTKEQFDNGKVYMGAEIGLRYESNEELVDRMLEVVRNGYSYYIPMIERATKTVTHFYSIEQNVNAIYNFYEEIMNNK